MKGFSPTGKTSERIFALGLREELLLPSEGRVYFRQETGEQNQ